VVWDRGVSLPGHRLWLDPLVVRSFAFISHAHTDHARRHKEALLTPQTLALIPVQRRPRGWRMLGFGEPMRRGSACVTLHPAGHMLGSAQLLCEDLGTRLLYTGDIKLRPPGASADTRVPKADVLVVESTYGRPHFRFGDPDSTLEMIARWCRRALDSRVTPVLLCHALGKAQEVMLGLAPYGFDFALEKRCVPCARDYALAGCSLPEWVELDPEHPAGRVPQARTR
jgi:Cft2 family RNA processing exonuclease